VAILEIGVTAALSAAATNWLILRRATPRRGAEGVWGERLSPMVGPGGHGGPGGPGGPGGYGGMESPHYRGVRGVAPPDQHDETDDAAGHRIYMNPWAAEDRDDW